MRKVLTVARTEYLNVVRTKAFVISVVLLPVFMGGAIVVQEFLKDKVDLETRRFAVVDRSGSLHGALERACANRVVEEDGRQVRPRFEPVRASGQGGGGDGIGNLAAKVRDGELFAYVVIPEDVVEGGEVRYHTASPTSTALPQFLRGVVDAAVKERRFRDAGVDQALVRRLGRPVPFGTYGPQEVTASGEVKEGERVDQLRTFGIPAVAMFLMFILVMTSAPVMLNNVLEEKMQRIAEILVASVSPFQLFLGKIVGIVLVSWTLSALYLGGAAYLAARFSVPVPPSLFAWFLLFQLLALFIFGSIFSAIGAACSEIRDAQSLMMPAMLVVMIPMFVWLPVLKSPDSGFATAMSLIPPVTPFLMMLRLAIPPGPAAWEIAAGVLLTAGFTLATVWAASRVFRVGILSQGQTPSLTRLFRWVFE